MATDAKVLKRRPWVERFWSHVDKDAPNGCWEWTAYRTPAGYGHFNTRDPEVKTRFPHRIAYFLTHGDLPEFEYGGIELDHLCRNPSCLNPDHLEAVTHRENMHRGNTVNVIHAARTHCPRGHAYDRETGIKRKKRFCSICNAETMRRYFERHRDELNAKRRAEYDPEKRRQRHLKTKSDRTT